VKIFAKVYFRNTKVEFPELTGTL